MLKNKSTIKNTAKPPKCIDSKMVTMQQAMDYLSEKGVPCKSRATFYRILDDFKVPFVNINPNGKHAVRRFKIEALDEVLKANGLK